MIAPRGAYFVIFHARAVFHKRGIFYVFITNTRCRTIAVFWQFRRKKESFQRFFAIISTKLYTGK
jgi:ABC-type transport system involved in cytochrome c biogenesis permease subunit